MSVKEAGKTPSPSPWGWSPAGQNHRPQGLQIRRAFRRMKKRGAIDADLKTATTDNGCEVSHQKNLERILGCPVYYTRAYASYEKGAVENVNRIIRRWFPKGTDFSKVSREDVLAVEAIVNSIHRLSLKGASAHEYHSRMAKAA